jgi:hypothetical protein
VPGPMCNRVAIHSSVMVVSRRKCAAMRTFRGSPLRREVGLDSVHEVEGARGNKPKSPLTRGVAEFWHPSRVRKSIATFPEVSAPAFAALRRGKTLRPPATFCQAFGLEKC